MDFPDIEYLVKNRQAFNEFVYTPLSEAVSLLEKRRDDTILETKVAAQLTVYIPEIMKSDYCAFLSRHVATPNYETRRFINLTDATKILTPILGEYTRDKFVSNNSLKYGLGKIGFFHGRDKFGGSNIEYCNCIDFNESNGKKISEVKTKWGQSLVSFHHEFFAKTYSNTDGIFFDASEWYLKAGGSAKDYYYNLVLLFIKNAILFENFMLDENELSFTRDIFLPAFIKAYRETGVKPLIVALEPTDIEGDNFWCSYPSESMDFVKDKLKLS